MKGKECVITISNQLKSPKKYRPMQEKRTTADCQLSPVGGRNYVFDSCHASIDHVFCDNSVTVASLLSTITSNIDYAP